MQDLNQRWVPLEQVLKAVDDEEELTGDMPDEMYEALKGGDRDILCEVLRIVVRQTKLGIKNRIVGL